MSRKKQEKKNYTLEELEELVGKEQLSKLFIQHYLINVGKNFVNDKENEEQLDDIMTTE